MGPACQINGLQVYRLSPASPSSIQEWPRKLPGKLIHSLREGKAAAIIGPDPERHRIGKRPAMTQRFFRTPLLAVTTLVLLSAVLAACGPKRNLPPCPRVGILGDAQKATQYREGPGRDLTDVAFETELLDYNGGCKYENKEANVVVTFVLQVAATRGPAANSNEAQIPYFVAIVDKQQQNVLLRQGFVARVPFKEGQRRVAVAEELEQAIPLNGRRTSEIEILVGLEVPKDQLDRNRALRGF